jgi:hypothetical protein
MSRGLVLHLRQPCLWLGMWQLVQLQLCRTHGIQPLNMVPQWMYLQIRSESWTADLAESAAGYARVVPGPYTTGVTVNVKLHQIALGALHPNAEFCMHHCASIVSERASSQAVQYCVLRACDTLAAAEPLATAAVQLCRL